MQRIRIALLTPRKTIKKTAIKWTVFLSLILLPAPNSQLQAAFNDLPNDPLYSPYIEFFQQANIIVGDTAGGKPTGNLRPFDQIKRSEFTKITTLIRLLENAEINGIEANYQNLDLDQFTLKINQELIEYYKAPSNGLHFSDVKDKEASCASNPEGCDPWYGQYVNYASAQGLVKGFPDGTFKPGDPILRIHALKLLMAEDGEKMAYYDDRFNRIASDPRIENVNVSKCLEGADAFIIKNNGGDDLDASNLLSYALLADRLDFFGGQCEFFTRAGANTPEKRAELLQKPITRQEIARYFALTTSYKPLQTNHASDPTTSTKEENGMNFYDEDAKKSFEAHLKKYEDGLKNPDEERDENSETKEEKEAREKVEKEEKELIKVNQIKAEMTIKELAERSKNGRCCSSMDLKSSCKKISFSDYKISETSSYNYQTYEGGTWQAATKNGTTCYIPFVDILGGFEVDGEFNTAPTYCAMSELQMNLIKDYQSINYSSRVREIWTSEHSNELKMFMQIGLDLATKKAASLSKQIINPVPDCQRFEDDFEALNSGHVAASLRNLPTNDTTLSRVEKLIHQ